MRIRWRLRRLEKQIQKQLGLSVVIWHDWSRLSVNNFKCGYEANLFQHNGHWDLLLLKRKQKQIDPDGYEHWLPHSDRRSYRSFTDARKYCLQWLTEQAGRIS